MSDPKPIISEIKWGDSFTANPTREVEPSLAKKDLGWISNEKPPYQFFNWFMRRYYLWNLWIDQRFCDPNGDDTKTGLKDPDTSPTLPEITLDTGKVGINKLAPTSALDVLGNAFVDGTITSSGKLTVQAGGLEVTAGLLEAKAGATITGAALTASNSANVTGGLTVITGGISVTAGGLTVVAGGANITGNSVVTGTLTSTQKLTVNTGGLEVVSGLLQAKAGATITGAALTASNSANVSGGLTVNTGNSTVSDGNLYLSASPYSLKSKNITTTPAISGLTLDVSVNGAGSLVATFTVNTIADAQSKLDALAGVTATIVETDRILLIPTTPGQKLTVTGGTAQNLFSFKSDGIGVFNASKKWAVAAPASPNLWVLDDFKARTADNNIIAWGTVAIGGGLTGRNYGIKYSEIAGTGQYNVFFARPLNSGNSDYCVTVTAHSANQARVAIISSRSINGFGVSILDVGGGNGNLINTQFSFMVTAQLT